MTILFISSCSRRIPLFYFYSIHNMQISHAFWFLRLKSPIGSLIRQSNDLRQHSNMFYHHRLRSIPLPHLAYTVISISGVVFPSVPDIISTKLTLHKTMKFTLLLSLLLSIPFINAQTTTFDKSQWASASSQALSSDATLIFNFIVDFNQRYSSYIDYMAQNGMRLPTAIGNYFVGIQTIADESSLLEYVKTKDFPFNDFATMVTEFKWYSSILTEANATTFYLPEYFLNDQAKETENSGSVTKTVVESTSHISSSSSARTPSSTSSANIAGQQYVPMVCVVLASLLFL